MSRGYYSNGVDSSDMYLVAVGADKVPNVTYANANAKRTNLSAVGLTDITDFTDSYIFPSNSGESLTAVSDNAADVGNVIQIRGLDENFLLQEEIFVTNGLTPVNIPGTWTRVNEVNGLLNTFIGDITVAGANTYAVAYADTQQSSQGVYTSPADKRAHILTIVPGIVKVAGGVESSVQGQLKIRAANIPGGSFRIPFYFGLKTNGTTTITLENKIPQGLPGAFDLVYEAQATAASTTLYIRTAILLQDM